MFTRLVERGKAVAKPAGKDAKRVAARQAQQASRMRASRSAAHGQAVRAVPPMPRRSGRAGRVVYDLGGSEELPGRKVRGERDGPIDDAAANDAFENTGIALDFLREVFARNSIDGRGAAIVSAVHYSFEFRNAFWNGERMIYGDGDESIGNFAANLDIVAHELCHGVSQYLIPGGLGVERVPVAEREFKEQRFRLEGQGGALNESFCDVMASLVKQWHAGQDVREADWLIGRRVLGRGVGRAVRSLRSPGNERVTWEGDQQMRSMDQYFEGCEVHDASGIPNRAFYRAALKIGGRAWLKAGPIWFEAYDGLDRRAQFADFARATIGVARRRYGEGSVEHEAVVSAWRTVKVG
ncbi:MAG TPA: M4 family metallopeptidase [Ramlibacter sp.]|uniref:M4 family metallopeptidase n=1 Tax=Ramlibacter sp. TaxID=1917967 RepID=UPI002D1761B4|nr:M4 family metallopeptidase [Ramlibacter sp.]HVZ45968.1 M4 family metallopeptidase [Ramlibacter sp.]